MHVRRLLAAVSCAAVIASFASRAGAGPVVFGTIDRAVEATVTIDGVPQSDLKQSSAGGTFDQTASKSLTAGARSLSSSASQQSFIDADRLGSSGQLQLSLSGASAADAAVARSLFAASFEVTEPVFFALRANMAGDGLSTFGGKLKLERSDLVLLDTELTPQQPEISRNGELGKGHYSLRFEPLVGASGNDTAGSVSFALFMETSTVIPLPAAAWSGLAPLLLALGSAARRLI